MKRCFPYCVVVFLMLAGFLVKAQSGLTGINYQAVARNVNGTVMADKDVGVRISIIGGSANGAVQYREQHQVKTNALGLFTLQIGRGTASHGTFEDVPWRDANQFIKVEVAVDNGTYTDLGTMQLMSVPFALYAADGGKGGPAGPAGPAGPQGAKGDMGEVGPAGAEGAAGPAGPVGPIGPAGPQGAKGDMGDVGPAGAEGAAGPVGPAGPQGAKGDTGDVGPQGPEGPQGNPGPAGPIGPQGAKGDTGDVGPQGPEGPQGNPGPAGPIGPQGAEGDRGDVGPEGPEGPIGPAGPAGPAGSDAAINGVAAGGDLSGTYPDPTVARLQGTPVSDITPLAGQSLQFDGTQWIPAGTGAGAFVLPYVTVENNAATLFSITNDGDGVSLEGINNATTSNIAAVRGIVSSASPGGFSAAVRGINNGTGGLGVGVWGSQNGSGWGVYGSTPNGLGVYGNASANGTGVYANSNTGIGLTATSNNGVPASISIFNNANNNDVLQANTVGNGTVINVTSSGGGTGVRALTGNGFGIHGITTVQTSAGIVGDNNGGGEAIVGRTTSDIAGAVVGRNDGGGYGVRGFVATNTAGTAVGVLGQVGFNSSTGRAGRFENVNSNNGEPTVEINTSGTGEALLVDHTGLSGDLAVFQSGGTNMARIDKNGAAYFNGGVNSSGADIAEAFDVMGDFAAYEAGDVLVISVDEDRTVEKSSEAYSTLVVGVYATKPGVLLTEEGIDTDISDKVPMGVVGVIPTKVCLEGGMIKRGDLLVTSSQWGVAMKGDPDKVRVGQVIGKALQEYDGNGIGKIKVLVNVK